MYPFKSTLLMNQLMDDAWLQHFSASLQGHWRLACVRLCNTVALDVVTSIEYACLQSSRRLDCFEGGCQLALVRVCIDDLSHGHDDPVTGRSPEPAHETKAGCVLTHCLLVFAEISCVLRGPQYAAQCVPTVLPDACAALPLSVEKAMSA